MRYTMIMAGGAGTRLWPMSRKRRPKQLLPLVEGRSLLQLAVARLEGLVPPEQWLICTSEHHRQAIRAAVPEFTDDRILGEPMGRDTLNAVGLTAAVLAKRDPEAVFAVLTADHIIEPVNEYQRKVELAFELLEDNPKRLVTFSILPTGASTSYGYVERGDPIPEFQGAYQANRFIEKPDAKTAKAYLDAGTFGWNSGMFVFSAAHFLAAIEKYKPRAHEGLLQIQDAWDTPRQDEVLTSVYPKLQKISVDYAVLEPAASDPDMEVCTVAMGVFWADIGSWPTFGETLPADQYDCRSNTRTAQLDSRNVLAVSDDATHTIATVGCNDLIVVHTSDVTLVCPVDQAERVKELAESVDSDLQ
jgi:mannose-1-phosphate guanylyltransferase